MAEKQEVKLVRVKALRPFQNGAVIVNPGEIAEVPADRVAELTKDVKGAYDFWGERYQGDARDYRCHNLKRAELA